MTSSPRPWIRSLLLGGLVGALIPPILLVFRSRERAAVPDSEPKTVAVHEGGDGRTGHGVGSKSPRNSTAGGPRGNRLPASATSDTERAAPRQTEPLSEEQIVAKVSAYLREYRLLYGRRATKDEVLRIMGQLDEFNEQMSPHLVQRFEAQAKANLDVDDFAHNATLDLLFWCGGPAVKDFLKKHLASSGLPERFVEEIKRQVSGLSYNLRLDRIPGDAELAGLARGLTSSPSGVDRMAGAAVLGACPEEDSEALLRGLAQCDLDAGVRTAAFRALGRVGSEDALGFLRASLEALESASGEGGYYVVMGIRAAIDDLEERLGRR